MLVSIIGITSVEIIWIRNAINVRNERFDQTVVACLHNVANTIEQSREANFLSKFMFPNITPFEENSIENNLPFESSSSINIGRRYNGRERNDLPKDRDKSSNEDLQQQSQYDKWIEQRANELYDMSDKMLSELYQWDMNVEIDNRELQFALQRSFQYSGINTPFEFAVIKNGEVEEGTFSKTRKNDFYKTDYVVELFPNNFFRQDMTLAVVFPDRTNYIIGSMSWLLLLSCLFSLIILATFAFSLYYIVNQKKMSEMKADFINNMTHEFKTPIATISLAADTIINPKVINDEYRIRQFISMIRKENSRMNKKVETILQIASLENKEIDFKFDNVSINKIIERAVSSIEILVSQRNGTITTELRAEKPMVVGDREHLYNLVNNLLDNAIKYSKDIPIIKVESYNNDNGVIIAVEDNGIGMSKNTQNKIFDRFYRQTSGNVHNVKGFGLGLNYVKSIVDAHQGTISVNSQEGRGSRFEVFIPFGS